MAEEVREVVREVVKISDLLDQARAAEAIVLPEEVRARLCTFDLVRLRLLTFRHMIALADYAAENPKRWDILKLRYLNPDLSQHQIAQFAGVTFSVARYWIKNAVITEDIWKKIPL